mmetsp:Transcript_10101/g.17874  ORF Transcript_10101/g.17874 Transcript_10101/m.17874 type:complete len:231 (-) Transcript_10101:1350-2042(-)
MRIIHEPSTCRGKCRQVAQFFRQVSANFSASVGLMSGGFWQVSASGTKGVGKCRQVAEKISAGVRLMYGSAIGRRCDMRMQWTPRRSATTLKECGRQIPREPDEEAARSRHFAIITVDEPGGVEGKKKGKPLSTPGVGPHRGGQLCGSHCATPVAPTVHKKGRARATCYRPLPGCTQAASRRASPTRFDWALVLEPGGQGHQLPSPRTQSRWTCGPCRGWRVLGVLAGRP